MSRIKWTQGAYASKRGNCGGVELFGIHYRTRREQPAYSLSTELPEARLDPERAKNDSPDVLKEYAEQVLDAWLTQIGAFA